MTVAIETFVEPKSIAVWWSDCGSAAACRSNGHLASCRASTACRVNTGSTRRSVDVVHTVIAVVCFQFLQRIELMTTAGVERRTSALRRGWGLAMFRDGCGEKRALCGRRGVLDDKRVL